MRNKIIIAVCISSLFLAINPARADEAADIGKMLRSGQINEALQKVDAALAIRPKDAQMRFLKGLIYTEQNKPSEAISIFTKLTDDYPELPEPYNNLAVLYAATAQYDKARAALELAIRTNPTYGTAHENLGDVYAKLASQAYDKALQLDSGNATAKLKLTMVRNLVGNTTGGTNPKTNPSPATVVAAAKTETAKPETTKPESAKAETAKPEAPKAKSQAVADKEEDAAIKLVETWARTWSNQETNAYLACYAKDFQAPKGMSRKAWADDRRNKIEGKSRINVKLESISAEVDGSEAKVKFRQIYTSNQLTANSRKTLILTKQDGKWLIKQERTGS